MRCPACGLDTPVDAAVCLNCHPRQSRPERRAPAGPKWRSYVRWCLYAVLVLLIPTYFVALAHDAHNTGGGPHGGVYLVHLGEPATIDLEPLRAYYQQTLGLDVIVLPPVALDPSVFNPDRGQLVAERVVAAMRQAIGTLADDIDARVFGVVEQDMYIERLNWAYALSFRSDERFAIVSTARMTPPLGTADPQRDLVISRLRKMLTKNVGMMVYHLPASEEPTSILYNRIDGVSDLDRMDESVERLRAEFRKAPPRTPVDASYPCFVVSPLVEWGGQTPIEARVDRCMPGMRTDRHYDELEVDLRVGLLVTRHTDFLRPGEMPLVLTRASHSWDTISRSFGIGGNHPYDILLYGSRFPYTFLALGMADGASLRYDRVSEGTDFANAVYEHYGQTAFFGSVMRWTGSGWELRFRDGSRFLFPENYSGTRSHQGAPFAMHDAAGRRIEFQRDRDRRLMRLVSPSGRFLSFEYDNDYRVRQVTDDEGHVVRYEYDESGRLAAVDDGVRSTGYTYDGTLLSSIVGDDGARLADITYRDQRVAEIALADGRRVRIVPTAGRGDDNGASVEIVDANGVATSVGPAVRP